MPSRCSATWGTAAPLICKLESDRARWDARGVYFPEEVWIPDPFHILGRLWAVAHCFHNEGSDEAERFVEYRLRDPLQRRVGYVISGLRERSRTEMPGRQRREVAR